LALARAPVPFAARARAAAFLSWFVAGLVLVIIAAAALRWFGH